MTMNTRWILHHALTDLYTISLRLLQYNRHERTMCNPDKRSKFCSFLEKLIELKIFHELPPLNQTIPYEDVEYNFFENDISAIKFFLRSLLFEACRPSPEFNNYIEISTPLQYLKSDVDYVINAIIDHNTYVNVRDQTKVETYRPVRPVSGRQRVPVNNNCDRPSTPSPGRSNYISRQTQPNDLLFDEGAVDYATNAINDHNTCVNMGDQTEVETYRPVRPISGRQRLPVSNNCDRPSTPASEKTMCVSGQIQRNDQLFDEGAGLPAFLDLIDVTDLSELDTGLGLIDFSLGLL